MQGKKKNKRNITNHEEVEGFVRYWIIVSLALYRRKFRQEKEEYLQLGFRRQHR